MKRKMMSKGKDRRIFTNTARKVKKVNLSPVLHRGGFCL